MFVCLFVFLGKVVSLSALASLFSTADLGQFEKATLSLAVLNVSRDQHVDQSATSIQSSLNTNGATF